GRPRTDRPSDAPPAGAEQDGFKRDGRIDGGAPDERGQGRVTEAPGETDDPVDRIQPSLHGYVSSMPSAYHLCPADKCAVAIHKIPVDCHGVNRNSLLSVVELRHLQTVQPE